jgi:hypothetical protein
MKSANKKARSVNHKAVVTRTAGKRRGAAVAKTGTTIAVVIPPLSANSLKEVLWETLNRVRQGDLLPSHGDAIAGVSREILRTVRTQMSIASQAKRALPAGVISFSERG